jgi:hypothetical protein
MPETRSSVSESATVERLVGGRYRLLGRLGKGGMGTVWRAHDEILDREVAVKEIVTPPELSAPDRESFSGRTIREARAAGRVSHPGVAAVYDVFEEDGHPWIVLELVPSRTLGSRLREHGPLPPREVAAIALQVLGALRAAHAAGVLHRDVKPDNVLLADDGRAVLTDFGIATLDGESSLTRTGVLIGTPAFIAPERAAGGHADRACDLWSLGVTMYVAVEGRSPFHRGHVLATMAAVLHEEPEPVRRAGPLTPIIEGLLRKDPGERLTADELEPWLRIVAEARAPEPTEPHLRVPFIPPPPRAPTSPRALPMAATGLRAAGVRAGGPTGPSLAGTVASAAPPPAAGRTLGMVAALTLGIGLIAGGVAYMTASPGGRALPGPAVPYQVTLPNSGHAPTPTPRTSPPPTTGTRGGAGTRGSTAGRPPATPAPDATARKGPTGGHGPSRVPGGASGRTRDARGDQGARGTGRGRSAAEEGRGGSSPTKPPANGEKTTEERDGGGPPPDEHAPGRVEPDPATIVDEG